MKLSKYNRTIRWETLQETECNLAARRHWQQKLELPKLIFILYFELEANRARSLTTSSLVRGLLPFFIKQYNEIIMTVKN